MAGGHHASPGHAARWRYAARGRMASARDLQFPLAGKIHTARDDVSIATYGLVAAPVEEDPELDTIESVSQRAASKLRRHTYPTQIFDVVVRPGTSGPFEGHGVPIVLPRHGVNGEIWLVEEVEIEELESQLLQWRLTLLQRDHESLYAQSVKPHRIQPSEPANIGAIPGILTVLTDASRIGSESDLFSAFLGGSHAERITSNLWTDIPRGSGRAAPRSDFRDQRDSVVRDREADTADGRTSGHRRRSSLQPDHRRGSRSGGVGHNPPRRLPRLDPPGA